MVRDSVVGIATSYRLDGPEIESPWERDFPHSSSPAMRPTEPPIQWDRVSFTGVQLSGRALDHPPQSSAEVKERLELYIYSSSGPSWPVLNFTFTFYKIETTVQGH
jgi:hypothetical protein